MQGKRNSTMDIVKAIGIISIVMGHCCYSIMIPALNVSVGEFVYSYHLMVFFFVAGFFYKRGYHEHPEQYIGKRLLKLGGMLFLYNTVFTLLHNTLVSVKMISSTEHYSISKMHSAKQKKVKNRNIGIRSSVFCLLLLHYMQTVGS